MWRLLQIVLNMCVCDELGCLNNKVDPFTFKFYLNLHESGTVIIIFPEPVLYVYIAPAGGAPMLGHLQAQFGLEYGSPTIANNAYQIPWDLIPHICGKFLVFKKQFPIPDTNRGLCLLSGRTSYRRLRFTLFQSLWNLTGTSAAALPRWLANFGSIRS